MLNYLWFSFFACAFIAACWQTLFMGNSESFSLLSKAMFDSAKLGFDVAIGLTGVLCMWLGLLAIAEKAGMVGWLARGLTPLFRRLMPELPAGHKSMGSMTMNFAANLLGLDNAATPMGLKAMQELQELNPSQDTASNAQILFLVINASSITLIPVSIFMYRAQAGAADPADVFIPILLATFASTFAGVASVAWVQKLPLFDRVVMTYLGGMVLLVSAIVLYFTGLEAQAQKTQSAFLGNFILIALVMLFLTVGVWKKVPVYETFVEGAKEGFAVAVKLIPYLVAMLVAIGVLRASGVFEYAVNAARMLVSGMGMDTAFVEALPTGLIKPFSGSAARAMMLDAIHTYGVDAFPARVAAVIQGSTETTFYVAAVYFGSVGIRKLRHALACALLSDAVGIVAAIGICYWFF